MLNYMMTYENFNGDGKTIYQELNQDQYLDILENYCTQYSEENSKIYRALKSRTNKKSAPFYYIKPVKGSRVSRNSFNFHTLIINNHPLWKDYPNRDVICTTRLKTATLYGNTIYEVIPFDNSKIGISPTYDIWKAFMKNYDNPSLKIYQIIRNTVNLSEKTIKERLQYDYNDFIHLAMGISKDMILKSGKLTESDLQGCNTLYDYLIKEINPKDFILETYHKGIELPSDSEVWLDNFCLMKKISK